MCDNEDLKKRVRRLEVAAVIFFSTGAVAALLLFAHLVHDSFAFDRLERVVAEHHSK